MADLSIRNLKDASARASVKTKRELGRPRAAGVRDYTYVVDRDCGGGATSQFVYILRGDVGSYREDWCGDVLDGLLSYVEDIVFEADGLSIPGYVYNGTDNAGTWGYFFSSDVVPELGAYLVMYGIEHVAGQPFNPIEGFPATRTAP